MGTDKSLQQRVHPVYRLTWILNKRCPPWVFPSFYGELSAAGLWALQSFS